MGIRDRFFTPATAKAIMSWRILLGGAVIVGAGLAGVNWFVAAAIGIGAYTASVAMAMPKPTTAQRIRIDPFTVGEPWRRIVMSGQSAARRLDDTVRSTPEGPLHDRLADIAERLQEGLHEAWEIAQSGDRLDDSIRRLQPTRLRSNLDTARRRAEGDDNPANAQAVKSLTAQLATVERLQAKSDETATNLRLTQTRLDELVARANEVKIGSAPPDTYAADVESLIQELEALHLAVEEVREL